MIGEDDVMNRIAMMLVFIMLLLTACGGQPASDASNQAASLAPERTFGTETDAESSNFAEPVVISDAEGAHRAAFNEGNGFLIIVGTGSVLIYKKEENYLIEGGKNPPNGDPGSGKWIGIKYLTENKTDFNNWNDQKIASYTTEVINKAKNDKDELCIKILNEAFDELYKLIKQALTKFEKLEEINIALIGGVTSDEYFRNELNKYANDNIQNIKVKFFIPETSIQKASAMYAIKLNEEKNK